jgi:hypothetical protein
MKTFMRWLFCLTIFALFIITVQSPAQEYQTKLINKGPLYATSSVLQDYDDDGDLDIIITRRLATNDQSMASVEWLENDGTGQFPRRTLFQDLVLPVDIDLADFDKDGDLDYLASDIGTLTDAGQIVWFQRQSNGSFITWTIEAGLRIDQAAVADFDKDGNPDVVAVGFNLSTVNIYLNDGFLNFSKRVVADNVVQVDLVKPMILTATVTWILSSEVAALAVFPFYSTMVALNSILHKHYILGVICTHPRTRALPLQI